MGRRRIRQANQQAKRTSRECPARRPRLPALAYLIFKARWFRRLALHLENSQQTNCSQAFFDPKDKAVTVISRPRMFRPRYRPLGALLFRTRFVQQLLGSPFAVYNGNNHPVHEGDCANNHCTSKNAASADETGREIDD